MTQEGFESVIKYLKDRGHNVTVDRNPSPEKIAEIKAKIARNEVLREQAIERYKKINKK
jgi:hypothetical protein